MYLNKGGNNLPPPFRMNHPSSLLHLPYFSHHFIGFFFVLLVISEFICIFAAEFYKGFNYDTDSIEY